MAEDDDPGGKPEPYKSWEPYFRTLMALVILDDSGWWCLRGRFRDWISSSRSHRNLGHSSHGVSNLVAPSRPKNFR